MLTKLRLQLWLVCTALLATARLQAGEISGTFDLITPSTTINLSQEGPVDWVHWGTHTEYAFDRKSGVAPQISDFFVLGIFSPGNGPFYFGDGSNGYGWVDGTPNVQITNVNSGIYVVGTNFGVEFTAPADTNTRVLKVYVGAFGVAAALTATLSDGGSYSSTNLDYIGAGPSGVYTLIYTATAPDQLLTVDFMPVEMYDLAFGNVTLQAAALSYTNQNNPPTVALSDPPEQSAFAINQPIPIQATAIDLDGTITNVQFFAGTNLIGTATTSPFSLIWSNSSPGEYWLSAQATDNTGAPSTSRAISIFVYGTGSTLDGSFAGPSGQVMLTIDGGRDWAHWGLIDENSFDHKAGGPSFISNLSVIGENPVQTISDTTAWSWENGNPTPAVVNSSTCVFINGYTNGFELHLAAKTNLLTAKVYVGLSAANGLFEAFLDDYSAPPFIDTSLQNLYDQSSRTYILKYAAASNGHHLVIRYTAKNLYDLEFGSVSLSAASVFGPYPIAMRQTAFGITNFGFTISTATNFHYAVDYTDSLSPTNWQRLTNFNGTGLDTTVFNAVTTNRQRFFRLIIGD